MLEGLTYQPKGVVNQGGKRTRTPSSRCHHRHPTRTLPITYRPGTSCLQEHLQGPQSSIHTHRLPLPATPITVMVRYHISNSSNRLYHITQHNHRCHNHNYSNHRRHHHHHNSCHGIIQNKSRDYLSDRRQWACLCRHSRRDSRVWEASRRGE